MRRAQPKLKSTPLLTWVETTEDVTRELAEELRGRFDQMTPEQLIAAIKVLGDGVTTYRATVVEPEDERSEDRGASAPEKRDPKNPRRKSKGRKTRKPRAARAPAADVDSAG